MAIVNRSSVHIGTVHPRIRKGIRMHDINTDPAILCARIDMLADALASSQRHARWLAADRERIRDARDMAEVRMIEAESILAESTLVTVRVRVV